METAIGVLVCVMVLVEMVWMFSGRPRGDEVGLDELLDMGSYRG